MKYVKGFLINLQFFTIIPVPIELPMDKNHLDKAIKTFPLLGLLQGILYSLLLYVLVQWTPFSSLSIAFALWLATILVTGGIHLDGWIDASDAYFSYRDIEKRLEIMKDPRTGAFGVLSVLVLLSARFLFIYEVIIDPMFITYLLITFIPFLSKGVMGLLIVTGRPAKKEGLASLFRNAVTLKALSIYPVYLVVVGLLLWTLDEVTLIPTILLVVVALVGFVFLRMKSMKWFGGITGDVLGASVEGIELTLWMSLWLLHYFVMG
ncbi:adenosylcobinamide-GDP ribazoletransferase [Pseudalkalibacillus decolorationis]|uniref:adenosylcobinamide-GDP ribazoletransferase n=1 Tax=Pseudalkalibacillus decolorationis TaxID=163879 RepID=UPI00214919F3|nr:adenosylcobinamide-GDP ribazoletransferase [Pseudalkalibacillus decolorationis]